MARAKRLIRAMILLTGIGVALAGFAATHTAAAQAYGGPTCPPGLVFAPGYDCVPFDQAYQPYAPPPPAYAYPPYFAPPAIVFFGGRPFVRRAFFFRPGFAHRGFMHGGFHGGVAHGVHGRG
jgi:hypothetical protein